MSHVDYLLATRTPLELAKLLSATAKENAALRDEVFKLQNEIFWLLAVERNKENKMNVPSTGQELYALYTKKEEELNNCRCDGWEDLADEEQDVWNAMAVIIRGPFDSMSPRPAELDLG